MSANFTAWVTVVGVPNCGQNMPVHFSTAPRSYELQPKINDGWFQLLNLNYNTFYPMFLIYALLQDILKICEIPSYFQQFFDSTEL